MLGNLLSQLQKIIDNKSLMMGVVTGAIGAFIDSLFKAKGFVLMHMYIALLLIFVLTLDYGVGDRLAKKNKKYQSNIGIDAVIRDGMILLIVAIGWLFDQLLGTGAVVFAILAFAFIYHNLQSFAANIYVLGWDKHFPMWLFRFLESEINAKIEKYKKGDGK